MAGTRVEETTGGCSPACDHDGGIETVMDDLPADVLGIVLRCLDGASLAAAGCASAGFRELANDPDAWRALCLQMWPSLRQVVSCGGDGGYRALYADARRPVSIERRWVTGDSVARFTVVLGGGIALEAAVMCDERHGHIREISLCAADAEGGGVSGQDGLAAVIAAMASARQRRGAEEASRQLYEEFAKGKRERKERRERREGIVDLCCSGVGAAAFLAFLVMLTFQ
uniref:Uncharacterized protein n=1 Tax=Aegilops tauschii TaxID=37682 RepID=M8CE70_AEGTA